MKKLSLFSGISFLILAIFIMPKTNIDASELSKVTINCRYQQSSARSIYQMINDFRTGNDSWYLSEDNSKKIYVDSTPLYYDANLEKIAMQRAVELAVSYSHTRPNGTNWYTVYSDFNMSYSYACENVARGFNNAPAVHYAFREDSASYPGQGHRRNMLNSHINAVGIAHVVYNGVDYWAEEFASIKNITACGSANDSYTNATIYVDPKYANTNIPQNYTGLYEQGGTWFYVKSGKIDWAYNGLCLYNDTWYYIHAGIIDKTYTGLCRYGDGWYFVSGGKINWYATGLWKYNGNWFYVQNGKINFGYTGLAKNAGNWFYVQNGILNWKYTGLCKYNGSWFYLKNGVLDWKYTGLCRYGNTWYFIANGKLNWYASGLWKHNGSWFYVKNGRVDFGYTGLAHNAGYWFYIQNGVLNWKYTGICPYNGRNFNVRNGIVIF